MFAEGLRNQPVGRKTKAERGPMRDGPWRLSLGDLEWGTAKVRLLVLLCTLPGCDTLMSPLDLSPRSIKSG